MSLFEVMGAASITAGAALAYVFTQESGPLAISIAVVLTLAAGCAMYLSFSTLVGKTLAEPETRWKNAKGILLYWLMPISILAAEWTIGWLVRSLFE